MNGGEMIRSNPMYDSTEDLVDGDFEEDNFDGEQDGCRTIVTRL
jgi:hypothetical protein